MAKSHEPLHSFSSSFGGLGFHNSTLYEISCSRNSKYARLPCDANFDKSEIPLTHAFVREAFPTIEHEDGKIWRFDIHLHGEENLGAIHFGDRHRLKEGIYLVDANIDDEFALISYHIFLNNRLCPEPSDFKGKYAYFKYLLELTERTGVFAYEFIQIRDLYISFCDEVFCGEVGPSSYAELPKTTPSGLKNAESAYPRESRIFNLLASSRTIKRLLKSQGIDHMSAEEFEKCHQGVYWSLADIQPKDLMEVPQDDSFITVADYYIAWLRECRVDLEIVQHQTLNFLSMKGKQ